MPLNIRQKLKNLGRMTAEQFSSFRDSIRGLGSREININNAPLLGPQQPQRVKTLGILSNEQFEQFKNQTIQEDSIVAPNTPPQSQQQDIPTKIGTHETRFKELSSGEFVEFKDDTERYEYQHPRTGDLGFYQVSPDTLKSDAKLYLGRDVSVNEFLSSPQLQDEFIRNRIERWRTEFGMSDEEIIKRWNVGIRGDINSERAEDYFRAVTRQSNIR